MRLFRDEAPPAPQGQPSGPTDTEFERHVLSRSRQRGSDGGTEPPKAEAVILATVQAHERVNADSLLSQGVTAEEARLATALVSDEALAFALNIGKLRAMGFSLDSVCGALLQTNNDLERASEVLLAAAQNR